MKWIKTAKTSVSANRYGSHPSLDHKGQQSGASRLAAPSTNFVADSCVRGPTTTSSIRRDSRAIATCVLMLADLIKVGLLLVGMLGAGKSVKLIQLDVFRPHVGDYFPVGGGGLELGALSPTLDGGRVDMFDPGDGFRAETLESLIDGAFDFLFRSFQVVESRAVTVAKGSLVLFAADDPHHLTALEGCV